MIRVILKTKHNNMYSGIKFENKEFKRTPNVRAFETAINGKFIKFSCNQIEYNQYKWI